MLSAQPGIWWDCRLEGDTSQLYTVARATSITGDWDPARFREALRRTLEECPALGTRFLLDEDALPQQVPGAHPPAELEEVDLRREADPRAAALALARARRDEPLDLTGEEPLYRMLLARVGEAEWVWVQQYSHLLVDGWSIDALARRCAHHYTALERCRAPRRSPWRSTLPELLDAEQAYLHSEQAEADRSWWAESLSSFPPHEGPTLPPTAYSRHYRVSLDDADTRRLDALATAAGDGATWVDALQGLVAAWEARALGPGTPLTVGLPWMRRGSRLSARTPLPQVAVLPACVELRPEDTVLTIIRRLAATAQRTREHGRIRPEEISRLAREGGVRAGGEPLARIGLNAKLYDGELHFGSAAVGRTEDIANGPVSEVEYALSRPGEGEEARVLIEAQAHPERYGEEALAERTESLGRWLRRVLRAREDAPLARVSQLPAVVESRLEAAERTPSSPLLGPASRVPTPVLTANDLDTALDRRARLSPDAPALSDAHETLSCGEVAARVNRTARALRARGVREGSIVAVQLRRSVEFPLYAAAIIRLGAVLQPIDAHTTPARVEQVLGDTQPQLLIDDDLAAELRSECARPGRWSGEPLSGHAPAEAPVYVIHTSGSTGRPKGVVCRRSGLAGLMRAHAELGHGALAEAAGEPVRALHTASFSFDSSWDMLMWLWLGGHVHVCTDAQRRDPEDIIALVRRWKAQAMDVTPTLAEQLLDAGLCEPGQPQLGTFMIGGEAASPALWERLRAWQEAAAPGEFRRALNYYGPSETTVDAVGCSVDSTPAPVIGKPIPGVTCRVLGPFGQRVAPGEEGELFIGGALVGAGYLGQPEKTAERFLPDPYAPGETLYRTGDRVRWVEAGDSTLLIDFLGRVDQQVQIRGYRVEPEEVRHRVEEVSGRVAAVVPRKQGSTTSLVAYLVLPESEEWDAAALREKLAGALPDYMVPQYMVRVPALPMTVNGKLNVAELPEPEVEVAGAAARTPEEEALCAAMAGALGLSSYPADGDFFTLGGDSVSAMAVCSRLRADGWQLKPRDIFHHPRPQALAGALRRREEAPSLARRVWGKVHPLPILQRFAAAEAAAGALPHYDHAVLVSLAGLLPDRAEAEEARARLTDACAALLRVHPVLCARWAEGTLLVPRPEEAAARATDAVCLHEASPDEALDLARAQLDPREGRCLCLVYSPAEQLLVLCAHHLVIDAVSWRILLDGLRDALAGRPLAEEGTTLLEWSEALARAENGEQGWTGSCRRGDARRALLHLPPLPAEGSESWLLGGLLWARERAGLAGPGAAPIILETHGRHPEWLGAAGESADLSSTVGWLTAENPVEVAAPEDPSAPAAWEFAAREAIHRVTHRPPAEHCPGTPVAPCLLLNILASAPEAASASAPAGSPLRRPGAFAQGLAVRMGEEVPLSAPVEVNAFVGAEGVDVEWLWDPRAVDAAGVDAWHGALASWCEQNASTPRWAVPVPSECAGVELSAADLHRALEEYGEVLGVLPLSPLQRGILFEHALSGAYTSVTTVDLREAAPELLASGPLAPDALRRALRRVLLRNPQLGARFRSDLGPQPVQVIPAEPGEVPVTEEPEGRLAEVESEEHGYRFDVARELLLRARVVGGSVLVLSVHHLVIDGWSTGLLVQELLTALRGEPEDAAGPADPRAVVRAYQQAVIASRPTREEVEQLVEELQDAPSTLLGVEGASGTRGTHRTRSALEDLRSVRRPAPEGLGAQLSRCGLTLASAVDLAFCATLGEFCGQTEVVHGTTDAGRTEDTASLIGLFSTTYPVRCALDPDRTLSAQAADFQRAQASRRGSLSRVGLDELAAEGIPVAELFSALLVVENTPQEGTAGVRNTGFTHYPLTVLVLPGAPGEEAQLIAEYDPGVVDGAAVLEHLCAYLAELGTPGERPLRALSTTPAQPLRGEEVALPEETLVQWTLRELERSPEATALLDATQQLSAGEMARTVRRWARVLRARGVGRGDVVSVEIPRSADSVLAAHAIWLAGAIYQPIDPDTPESRARVLREDSGARVRITPAFLEEMRAGEADAPLPGPRPEDTAYLLHTSGSTGRPKGVRVGHRALLNRVAWMQAQYPIGPEDRVLHKTDSGFDVSLWELTWPFIAGASLAVLPAGEHRDPLAIARALRAGVTVCHFVPSMLRAFTQQLADTGAEPLPSLRHVICSGEALDARDVEALRHLAPAAAVHNLYGPTEAAIDVTWYDCPADAPAGPVPLGRPVWNTELWVLDPWGRPTPEGAPGELYIGGVQLAEGYHEQPERTAEAFRRDLLDGTRRLYRTGDIVLRRGDQLHYLGRRDDQVKIRGQRIELGEVRALLSSCPAVADVTVGLVDGELAAWWVPAPAGSSPLSPPEWARQHCPRAALPSFWAEIPALPLTAAGKVNRAQLPTPTRPAADHPGAEFAAPQSELERAIARAMAEVLGCAPESLSCLDNFFDRGGHSLAAIQMSGSLRRTLGTEVGVGLIMQHPTVRGLARALELRAERPQDPSLAAEAAHSELLWLAEPAPEAADGPLVCLHPASGFGWQYAPLATHAPRGGVLAIQSPDEQGALAQAETLADIVEHDTELLRAHSHGPYRLLGYSLGGLVAIGMAEALRARGEEVEFVGLIDTYPAQCQDWGEAPDPEEVEAERLAMLRDGIAPEQAERIIANYARSFALMADAADAADAAASPAGYSGPVDLFIARRTLPEGFDPLGSWAEVGVWDVRAHELDCSHMDVLSPEHAGEVVPLILQALDQEGRSARA
nr:non-ribosomal peptide synthetase [Corynebacterium uropygiale]